MTDTDRLLDGLQRLGAIRVEGDRVWLAVPALTQDAWEPFRVGEVGRISRELADGMAEGADDLRQRMVHCSFANCDFSDSVGMCVGYARAKVGDAIRSSGYAPFPDKADFSWGVLFVY